MSQQAPPPQYSGGNFPPPQAAGNAAPYASAPTPTLAPGGKGKAFLGRLIGAVAVFVVVVIGLAVWKVVTKNPSTANVGDCVSGSVANANETKVVECTSAEATGKVVGKVDGKTEAEFNTQTEEICKPYPTAETAFWSGKSGRKGYVLCLEPVKK